MKTAFCRIGLASGFFALLVGCDTTVTTENLRPGVQQTTTATGQGWTHDEPTTRPSERAGHEGAARTPAR